MGAAGAVVHGELYVIGGEDENRSRLASVEVYDPATDTWMEGAQLTTARVNLAVAVVDGVLYAVGGDGKDRHKLPTVEAIIPNPTGR